jgi:hypothetical protein
LTVPLVEDLGNFRVAAAFDEAEGGSGSEVHRQLQQGLLDQHHVGAAFDDLLGLLGSLLRCVEQGIGIGEGIERHVRRPLRAKSVARYV